MYIIKTKTVTIPSIFKIPKKSGNRPYKTKISQVFWVMSNMGSYVEERRYITSV